ncbi:MAG: molybdopterin-synthase adenylyltransferase MoeB [Gammaproteobacteria bacterium]|nr:molybdopterin-synthase adenylyltransferase MoeB [Gammaproteobacteria bacterium]
MKDVALLRYSRQIMLPEMDVVGQQKLLNATVLIVGLGGLGCPAAMYLAAAGVGHLVLADDDTVEVTNLQRQIAHSHADLGQSKVESVCTTLQGLNPDVKFTLLNKRMLGDDLDSTIKSVNLVLDATDNFATRFAINRSCVKHRTPLVSGAAIRMEGQVAVFDAGNHSSPCYQCLYQEGEELDTSCASNGVMAPIVGIIGSVQAMEAIKMIVGIGESLCGRLLLLDAKHMQWREMKLPRDPYCRLCGKE